MPTKRDWLLAGVYVWIACAAGYVLYLALKLNGPPL